MNIQNLTIDLPVLPPAIQLTRQKNIGDFRERTSEEKYWRQAIQIYCANGNGELEDSGFIQLNDYTDMCKMIRVLPKHKECLHAFDRWMYYGSEFFKVDTFNIRNLISGNFVEESPEVPHGMGYNDLKKDDDYLYSKVLLVKLEEYSELNKPEKVRERKKKYDILFAGLQKDCDCNLFETLEIAHEFKRGLISEEEYNEQNNNLVCQCNLPKSFDPEPTEEQREKFELRACAEIAEMFIAKAIQQSEKIIKQNYNNISEIELCRVLKELKNIFENQQKAQDGLEIEKVFIEIEIEKIILERIV